jgi:hypothetical protein
MRFPLHRALIIVLALFSIHADAEDIKPEQQGIAQGRRTKIRIISADAPYDSPQRTKYANTYFESATPGGTEYSFSAQQEIAPQNVTSSAEKKVERRNSKAKLRALAAAKSKKVLFSNEKTKVAQRVKNTKARSDARAALKRESEEGNEEATATISKVRGQKRKHFPYI